MKGKGSMGKGTRADLSPGKTGGAMKGGHGVAHTKGTGGGFGIAQSPSAKGSRKK